MKVKNMEHYIEICGAWLVESTQWIQLRIGGIIVEHVAPATAAQKYSEDVESPQNILMYVVDSSHAHIRRDKGTQQWDV